MGILDRLLGRRSEARRPQWTSPPPPAPSSSYGSGAGSPPPRPGGDQRRPQLTDEQAIDRYRYMLRTAPPEAVEAAHAEAFAQLTPDQRRQVLQELAGTLPPGERYADDPQSLARAATRAEFRQPGTLVQVFGGGFGAPGYGGGYGPGYGPAYGPGYGPGYGGGFGPRLGGGGMGVGGTLLTAVAGAFVGSAIADALIPDDFGNQHWGDDDAYGAEDYREGYQEGYQDAHDQGNGSYAGDGQDFADGTSGDSGDFGGGDLGGGGGWDDGGGDFGGDDLGGGTDL